jgi:hypothetical protein
MKFRILIFVLGLLAAVYAADDLSVRYRIPNSRQPFGTVTVQRYDAISEKNKTEFVYEGPIHQTCVRSVFPHLGYQPCWYLSRHTEQRTNY